MHIYTIYISKINIVISFLHTNNPYQDSSGRIAYFLNLFPNFFFLMLDYAVRLFIFQNIFVVVCKAYQSLPLGVSKIGGSFFKLFSILKKFVKLFTQNFPYYLASFIFSSFCITFYLSIFFYCCVKYIQSKKKCFRQIFFITFFFYLLFFFFIFLIAVLNTLKVKKNFSLKFFSIKFYFPYLHKGSIGIEKKSPSEIFSEFHVSEHVDSEK